MVIDKNGDPKRVLTREFREYATGAIQSVEHVEDYADLLRVSQYPYMHKYQYAPQEIPEKTDHELEQEFFGKTGFSEMPLYTEAEIYDSAKKFFGVNQIDSKGIIKVSIGSPKTTGVWSDGEDFVNPKFESALELYYPSLEQVKDQKQPNLIRFRANNYGETYDKPKLNIEPISFSMSEMFHSMRYWLASNQQQTIVDNSKVDFVNLGTYRLMEDGTYANVTTFVRDEDGNLHFEKHTYAEILEEYQKIHYLKSRPEVNQNMISIMEDGISAALTPEECNRIMSAKDKAPKAFSEQYQILEKAYNKSLEKENIGLTLGEIGSATMDYFKENPNKETIMGEELEKGVKSMGKEEPDIEHSDKGDS